MCVFLFHVCAARRASTLLCGHWPTHCLSRSALDTSPTNHLTKQFRPSARKSSGRSRHLKTSPFPRVIPVIACLIPGGQAMSFPRCLSRPVGYLLFFCFACSLLSLFALTSFSQLNSWDRRLILHHCIYTAMSQINLWHFRCIEAPSASGWGVHFPRYFPRYFRSCLIFHDWAYFSILHASDISRSSSDARFRDGRQIRDGNNSCIIQIDFLSHPVMGEELFIFCRMASRSPPTRRAARLGAGSVHTFLSSRSLLCDIFSGFFLIIWWHNYFCVYNYKYL